MPISLSCMNLPDRHSLAKLVLILSPITFAMALLGFTVHFKTLFYREQTETVWENVTLKAVRAPKSADARLIISHPNHKPVSAPCLGDDMCPQHLTDPPRHAHRIVFVKQSPNTAIVKTIDFSDGLPYTNQLLTEAEYQNLDKKHAIKFILTFLSAAVILLFAHLVLKRLQFKKR